MNLINSLPLKILYRATFVQINRDQQLCGNHLPNIRSLGFRLSVGWNQNSYSGIRAEIDWIPIYMRHLIHLSTGGKLSTSSKVPDTHTLCMYCLAIFQSSTYSYNLQHILQFLLPSMDSKPASRIDLVLSSCEMAC